MAEAAAGATASGAGIGAILFDKDGTLFDFEATWTRWAVALLDELSGGDRALAGRLAGAIGFDIGARRYRPDSPVIAGTPAEVAALLAPHLPGQSDLEARINRQAAAAPQVEAVPLAPLLDGFRARGLRLGVATNDAEAPARAHLAAAGVAARFDLVLGSDSGHGGKPGPGQLLAFARAVALPPARIVMVGDSTHDLLAARAAGMIGIGVLTGPAEAAALAPVAAAVLPDIGHLPRWLAAREGRAARGGDLASGPGAG